MEEIKGIDLATVGHERTIVGMVLGGDDDQIILGLPNEEILFDNMIHRTLSVEEWEKILFQLDTLQTEVTQGEHLPKIILRKSERNIEQSISWEVFRRDEFKCRYCGADNVPMTVDHLITWESGGPSTVDNLVCSCKKCNRIRGNMSYGEWLKSDYYNEVSKNLSDEIMILNLHLEDDIKKIPLRVHKKKR